MALITNLSSISKYFSITVKPEILGSIQTLDAFTANDILFNWTSFTLNNGIHRLVGANAIIRGRDGAAQDVAMDLLWANGAARGDIASGTAPTALGVAHAAIIAQNNPSFNNIIGKTAVTAADHTENAVFRVASSNMIAGGESTVLFEPYDGTAQTAAGTTFYVAGTCIGTPNFASTLTINGALSAGASNDVTVADVDARLMLAPGDTIVAQDDAAIGVIGTIPDATSILLKDGATNTAALTDDDEVYNLNPITLRLTFERL